jgi:putative oxidoreductase
MHEETSPTDIPGKIRALPLTLLRMGVGMVMTVHGWGKLTDIAATQQQFANIGIPVADASAYLAVAGELLGGLGLLVGLFTPIAALGVLVTMLVAIVFVHLPNGLLMKNNGFEYPMVMALVSLYLAVRGAGPLSVDAWLTKHKDLPDWLPIGQADSQVSA